MNYTIHELLDEIRELELEALKLSIAISRKYIAVTELLQGIEKREAKANQPPAPTPPPAPVLNPIYLLPNGDISMSRLVLDALKAIGPGVPVGLDLVLAECKRLHPGVTIGQVRQTLPRLATMNAIERVSHGVYAMRTTTGQHT